MKLWNLGARKSGLLKLEKKSTRSGRNQPLFLKLIVRMANPKFSFWKFMFLMLSSRELNCLVRVHSTCSTKCRTQVTFLILSWGTI
ncbi:hypothetical protein COP2_024262 [Malus domestica]